MVTGHVCTAACPQDKDVGPYVPVPQDVFKKG